MGRGRIVSPLAMACLVVMAALAVGVWLVIRHGVEQQNQALVKDDTAQVVLLLQTAIQTEGSELNTVGIATTESDDSPTVFATQAKNLVLSPGVSLAAVNDSVVPPRVILAAGPNLHQGEQLPGPLAAIVSKAGPTLSSGPLAHIGTKEFLAFSKVPPATTGRTVILETSEIEPSKASPNESGPYSQLDIAIYATPTPQPGQLAVSTVGLRPLPKPTASAELKVGALEWDVVGAAKAPLVGGSAETTPWVVLAVGLLVAVVLAMTVQILVRRHRYAALMVAEREAELSEAQALLVRQERLSAVGEMATVIGHELRNPLAAAINFLFMARNRIAESDPDLDSYLSRAERETSRAAALADDLTSYMRERSPDIVHLDLRAVLDEVLESAPPPQQVTVSLPEPGIALDADKDQIIQALVNLVTNAYQAMAGGGSLTIAGSDADDATEVTAQDSGEGIDPTVAGRLFEPFVTTKVTGTGLGLAIVKRIVEGHGGAVTIDNGPTGGAL